MRQRPGFRKGSGSPSRSKGDANPPIALIDRPVPTPVLDLPALRQALVDGLAALNIVATETQSEQLLQHLALIQRWTQVYNLTAIREAQAMLSHHVLDALAALPPLRSMAREKEWSLDASTQVLDVGSGAGLPSVPWAILEPALAITAIDTVAKKAGFMSQVGAELRLSNFRAVHGRVEGLQVSGGCRVITSRAFASLSDFVAWTRHLLAPEGVWMALKGQEPGDEINQLPPEVEVFHVERVTVPQLDAQRCVVWMRPRQA
jgi:16S rRNA (guanine527-N7)-methyltransferase